MNKHGYEGGRASEISYRSLLSTDIRTVQELQGHSDLSTTMIYTHVLKIAGGGSASPLDLLLPA